MDIGHVSTYVEKLENLTKSKRKPVIYWQGTGRRQPYSGHLIMLREIYGR